MRHMFLVLGIVLSMVVGSGVATARQVDVEVETRLLLVLQANETGTPVDPDLLADTALTIERRIAALGIEDAEVWLGGGDQIVVELPGVDGDEADGVTQAIVGTGLLEIVDPQGQFLQPGAIIVTSLGGPTDGVTPASDTVYETIISGDDLKDAYATTNQVGQPVVGFELTDEAADRFFAYTSSNIGKPLSIVIDKRVVSSPVVNDGIRNQGVIEGLAPGEVDNLVTQLNSGALAVPLHVVTSLVLTDIPATFPDVPTPTADEPVTASECWTAEQRLDTATPQWSEPPAMVISTDKQYTATMETNLGTFTLALFPEDAPVTVNNFVCLARAGFYDNTPFHRIIDGFVIQGGDPTGTGTGGPGYEFADEPVSRSYELGTLAMANAGPDTNGSQFFIVVGENGTQLPPNYTIFGQVIDGMDVVNRIAKVPTQASDTGEPSSPIEPVTLLHVTIDET